MSEHVQLAITDCEQKIATLTDLVEKLRWFQREFPHTAASVERVTPRRGTIGRPKKAAKRNERTNEQEPRRRAARSRPDGADRTAEIVAAIRKAGGVMKRAELMAALGTSLYHTIHWLKVAIKTKAVIATGAKASYRISLPGKLPAKEGP